jgi:hypothetical protein
MRLAAIDVLSYDDVRDIVKAIRKFLMSLGLNRNEIQIEIRLNQNGVLIFNVYPYGSRAWELLYIIKGITCEKLENALKRMIHTLLPWLAHLGLIDVHVEYALRKGRYGLAKRLARNERFLLPRQKHRLPRVKHGILEKQEDTTMRAVFTGDLYPLLFRQKLCFKFLSFITLVQEL